MLISGVQARPEVLDLAPLHEGPCNAMSSYALSVLLDGASYVIRKPVRFNRIIVRSTSTAGAARLSLFVMQAPDGGGASVANRVATVNSFLLAAAGTHVITPDEGNVLLKPGIIHVLYGIQNDGLITMRTWLNVALDLLNQNVDAGSHKITFTTALSANVSPSTFTPLSEATASILDIAPMIRFKKV